jgi:D-alanine transaminase
LLQENGSGNLGVYLDVTRGADTKHFHAYPDNVSPTVFAFAFDISPAPEADKGLAKKFKVTSSEDLNWKRCQIKSTSLLGNVIQCE